MTKFLITVERNDSDSEYKVIELSVDTIFPTTVSENVIKFNYIEDSCVFMYMYIIYIIYITTFLHSRQILLRYFLRFID